MYFGHASTSFQVSLKTEFFTVCRETGFLYSRMMKNYHRLEDAMSRTCPQCGTVNRDDNKFCTSCGNSTEPVQVQPGSSGTQAGPASGDGVPVPGRQSKILIWAGVAGIAIIAIFLVLTNPGISSILPSSAFPVTTYTPATPDVTSQGMVETPFPEPATLPVENLSLTTTIPGTSQTSPTPVKEVVCPSDRHICGANCTDFMTDSTNCGACGLNCSDSQSCEQGVCIAPCSSGEVNCFDGCHNLSYDAGNCGTCGNTCPVGLECNKSICSHPLETAIPTYAG
jgi:hypothetical protein